MYSINVSYTLWSIQTINIFKEQYWKTNLFFSLHNRLSVKSPGVYIFPSLGTAASYRKMKSNEEC